MFWWVLLAVVVACGAAVAGLLAVRRTYRLLPKPQTFAEGQRLVFGWLASGAGIFCGGVSLGMIALLMWGGWSDAEEHTIVIIFGWTLGGFVSAMIVVLIGLLVGGPVGRFSGGITKGGLNFEAGKEDHATASSSVTVETKVEAASTASEADEQI